MKSEADRDSSGADVAPAATRFSRRLIGDRVGLIVGVIRIMGADLTVIPHSVQSANSARWDAPGAASWKGRSIGCLCALLMAALLASCGGGEYQIDLMPAPAVYADGTLSPFPPDFRVDVDEREGILYATLREPADPDGAEGSAYLSPYLDKRGSVGRVGIGQVELVSGPREWQEAIGLSLAKDRGADYRLRLVDIDEFGILADTVTEFEDPDDLPADLGAAGRHFAARVNAELARSTGKDVLVYVHGYKVPFPDPVLVSAELWHFLGYHGAVVAFSWPSTPSRLAYFSDLDTTDVAAFGFRRFLEFLARETDVERIHVLGYSAGTRLVALTVYQLALLNKELTPAAARANTRLGQVILVGSDMDRHLVGTYLADGILDAVEGFNIYMSKTDKALGVSRFLLSYERMGEMVEGEIPGAVADYLLRSENLYLINVTEAEGAATDNGHGYFRKSPWASSDILSMIRYGLSPAERGLVREPGVPIWTFPPDYVERLQRAIIEKQATAAP
ncbi:MAG: alpha/beta hydrolase [Rhodospirillales bacterium]|nr:MAG: alpha/beta hydrolase [Rhodospirillales bacterium]